MMTCCLIVIVIVLLLIVACYGRDLTDTRATGGPAEHYGVCTGCDDLRMGRGGTTVMNPYVWPYSGTPCVDDLYILAADKGVDVGFSTVPLTHLSTPDHVELVT